MKACAGVPLEYCKVSVSDMAQSTQHPCREEADSEPLKQSLMSVAFHRPRAMSTRTGLIPSALGWHNTSEDSGTSSSIAAAAAVATLEFRFRLLHNLILPSWIYFQLFRFPITAASCFLFHVELHVCTYTHIISLNHFEPTLTTS